MNRKIKQLLSAIMVGSLLLSATSLVGYANQNDPPPKQENGDSKYSLEQAMSDRAQLTTIAFSGLAFITGDFAADTFMPPGKVADFFGFQYMRDVDVAGYGHNTQFLSRVANNMISILNDDQLNKLILLSKSQASLYDKFAYNRLPLIQSFRAELEGNFEEDLVIDKVAEYTKNLYEIDAQLSYERAVVMGEIISSFSTDQREYLGSMSFNDFNTWPNVDENKSLKESLTHTQHVALMTYASEMFSWYKGNVKADIYFCPERHGTYFGGFFLKDFPAMNNPDYFISTTITGNKGDLFLDILTSEQRQLMTSILDQQNDAMNEIASIRTKVSNELRKVQDEQEVDKDYVYALIMRYGELDGKISAIYASVFSQINESLSSDQRSKIEALRELDETVDGVYLFSSLVEEPALPDISYMFGEGDIDPDAGNYDVPAGYETKDRQEPQNNQNNRPPRPDDGNRPPRSENKPIK